MTVGQDRGVLAHGHAGGARLSVPGAGYCRGPAVGEAKRERDCVSLGRRGLGPGGLLCRRQRHGRVADQDEDTRVAGVRPAGVDPVAVDLTPVVDVVGADYLKVRGRDKGVEVVAMPASPEEGADLIEVAVVADAHYLVPVVHRLGGRERRTANRWQVGHVAVLPQEPVEALIAGRQGPAGNVTAVIDVGGGPDVAAERAEVGHVAVLP